MSEPLKCLVVDDEPLAIQLLTDYIKKTDGLVLAKSFSNPIKALQFIPESEVDLIFLDVQMPELTGVQMMKILNQNYPIILTTAYEQYAIDGFEHNVVDYLLKPISYERFYIAVKKAMSLLKPVKTRISVKAKSPSFIFVKSEYKVQKIDLDKIQLLEGLGDYVAIHTTEGKLLTLENIKHFERILPENDFMRVHKSYIIAFSKIEYIERNRVVIGSHRVPVSDTYKKAFWDRVRP